MKILLSNMPKTKVAGLDFSGYAINASGINNQALSQLKKIADSPSAAVMLKSTTLEKRLGNPNPKYIVKSPLIPGCTFNSMGLPNDGIAKSLGYVEELKEYSQKPVIISISGLSLDENVELFKQIQTHGKADAVEINLSCPNVIGKPIIGYDLEQIETTLKAISKIKGVVKLGLKLPPYLDVTMFDKVAKILLEYKDLVKFISTINTVSALVIDPKKESVIIKPKNGVGGLGGDFVKPIGLLNVRSFYERLNGEIAIIGVGGIRNGTDAFEYLLAGADSVQVGTAFAHEGIKVFEKIEIELKTILEEKGYQSIEEIKGGLKTL